MEKEFVVETRATGAVSGLPGWVVGGGWALGLHQLHGPADCCTRPGRTCQQKTKVVTAQTPGLQERETGERHMEHMGATDKVGRH